jgi:hypothetical protein
MPGVSVRMSHRGVNMGVGPRALRAHVGTSGLGMSSGVGPVSGYVHIAGGGRGGGRRYYYGPSQTSIAQLERETRKAQRQEDVARVADIERALVSFHLQHFVEAAKPQLPEPPDLSDVVASHLQRPLAIDALERELGGGLTPPVAPASRPASARDMRSIAKAEGRAHARLFGRTARREAREAVDRRATELAAAETQRAAERAVGSPGGA